MTKRAVEELWARIEAVRVVRVEVKRKSVTESDVRPGRTVKPNLWPRVTFECEGRTRVVAMTKGLGDPMDSSSRRLSHISREIFRMAGGRSANLSGRTWLVLQRASVNIRSGIMKKMRAAASKKEVLKRVEKETRSIERAAMIQILTQTLKDAHGVLNKGDIVKVWESVKRDKTVTSVMEA